MGISVDHEARKREIIAKAVGLFAKEGYSGVTYQKIADACGIARTTLYRYFPSKGIIFNTAIWRITRELTDRYAFILSSRTSVAQRLERLLCAVLAMIYRQRPMLTVIFDYLIDAQRGGRPVARDIAAHTIGLKRILHRLLFEGVRNGELRDLGVKFMTEALYAQLESAVLRLTLTQNADHSFSEKMLRTTIENLRKEEV
ncbi:MAG: TetR/AcrR family transcriptional regulator [Kiritimatiellae bacterium]|nr:TetR/AcrR family transcriptional regulator [Kiritimatiellia bacterium]